MRAITRSAVTALALAALGGSAQAQQVVITSKSPFWKVGVADAELGKACSLGRFGMAEPEHYVARFTGATGAAVLGIAKGSGLNLYDPDHHAKPEEDYFFRAHGTTSCEVYVGGRKGGAPAPGK